MPRKANTINWTPILWVAGVLLGYLGMLVTFYFNTNYTLSKHDEGLKSLATEIKASAVERKSDFDKWLATEKASAEKVEARLKADTEKAEARLKEDREQRDKMREQFQGFIGQLTTSSAATKIQVETAVKQLDALDRKLESISTTQQNSIIRQQGRR